MMFMKKLRILFPGCPLEEALNQRARLAEQMSADISEMAQETTQFMERRFHDVTLDQTDRRRRAG